jgi:DNA-binding MarR family transcriptional regulator
MALRARRRRRKREGRPRPPQETLLTELDRPHLEREQIALRRRQTEVMLAFSRVNQLILKRSGELLGDRGFQTITPSQANALIVLFNARRPMNARELARELAVSEVTVSRFLRKMEEEGWVERTPDPADGRSMLLRTTAYARSRFLDLAEVSNALLDSIFGGLAHADLDRLASVVQRVQSNLGRPVDDDGVAPKLR